jgi:hypothetical protein
MLAEKCPNCGAYLPVRRAGVTVRSCEFCGLEVPGEVIEVPRLTQRRIDIPSAATMEAAAKPVAGIIVGIVVAGVVAVGGILLAVNGAKRSKRPPTPTSTTAEAEAPIAATAPAPNEKPEAKALREAIEKAGGTSSVDLVALGAFADAKIKSAAPDAIPIMFTCTYVRADGRADLTLRGDARCTWEYRSPSRVKRPDGTPAGITVSVPCILSFSAGSSQMYGDIVEHTYGLGECRQWFALRPPRCTPAEIWDRAKAKGAPADAVAHLHLGARYRSAYDPVDTSDEPDHPERGIWSLEIDSDTGKDFRFETPDNCGEAPPTPAERAVFDEIKKVTTALLACANRAAGKHDSVVAFEQIWRLARDGNRSKIVFTDPGVDIEGIFSGNLDGIRESWATCADAIAPRIKLPEELPAVRLILYVDRGASSVTVSPPPFD